MKKYSIIFFSLFLITTAYTAQLGEIVYYEGNVEIKGADNRRQEVDFGESVKNGDTIITGSDGYIEIETDKNTVKINSSTVFTFREAEFTGKKRNVFTCISGSALFKISKITGTAPEINTLSANTGVRGTEFSLFAADNGSSLITVTEGMVEVSAGGRTVALTPGEGVEVSPGNPPGVKFQVLRGELNFETWNNSKLKEFLADPVNAVYRLYSRLEVFAGEAEKIDLIYKANAQLLALERANLDAVKQKEGTEAAKSYYADKVLPLEIETSYQVLNKRYYALSALSLRRYVLSRLYLLMKSKYVSAETNQTYNDYLYAHNQLLRLFEKRIVPFLVAADI